MTNQQSKIHQHSNDDWYLVTRGPHAGIYQDSMLASHACQGVEGALQKKYPSFAAAYEILELTRKEKAATGPKVGHKVFLAKDLFPDLETPPTSPVGKLDLGAMMGVPSMPSSPHRFTVNRGVDQSSQTHRQSSQATQPEPQSPSPASNRRNLQRNSSTASDALYWNTLSPRTADSMIRAADEAQSQQTPLDSRKLSNSRLYPPLPTLTSPTPNPPNVWSRERLEATPVVLANIPRSPPVEERYYDSNTRSPPPADRSQTAIPGGFHLSANSAEPRSASGGKRQIKRLYQNFRAMDGHVLYQAGIAEADKLRQNANRSNISFDYWGDRYVDAMGYSAEVIKTVYDTYNASHGKIDFLTNMVGLGMPEMEADMLFDMITRSSAGSASGSGW